MPLQVLRPSIVVGDSRTGRTTSFNVLYGPLKAFARGAIPAIPAAQDAPVDIVPVDYVADRVHGLARRARRHLPPRGRAQRHDRRPPDGARLEPVRAPGARVLRPASTGASCTRCCAGQTAPPPHGGLLPVLRHEGPLRRPPARAGPSGGGVFPPPRRFAQAASWGRRVPYPCVIERLVEQIEGRFAELSEQMSDPEVISDQRRYAEVGRAYRALEPAHALAQEWRRAHRRRRGRPRAAGRGRRGP